MLTFDFSMICAGSNKEKAVGIDELSVFYDLGKAEH